MSSTKRIGDIALEYVRRGWNPLPLPYKTKTPTERGWQHRVIREEDVPKYSNGQPQNVGVILGATSGGLTDIDLDCREAAALAAYILPKTGAIFGRASNRASHWLYRTDLHDAAYGAEVKFQDPTRPIGKVTILETRIGGKNADGEIKGAQTSFPDRFMRAARKSSGKKPVSLRRLTAMIFCVAPSYSLRAVFSRATGRVRARAMTPRWRLAASSRGPVSNLLRLGISSRR